MVPPQVKAIVKPDSLVVGDIFDLEIEVTKDIMQVVDFPQLGGENFSGEIEIVEEGEIDTLAADGRRQTLRKKYRMQVFEEGNYNLGRFPVMYIDKNIVDTLWSADSLRMQVATFEIDPEKQGLYDIKPPMRVPLRFGEIGGYIVAGLLFLALVGALIWYIHTRRRNLTILGKAKPVEPPHLKAIKALEAMHHQKLWQNGKHKLYYTRLTDILREYIEGRYGIRAMEMTSGQIMEGIDGLNGIKGLNGLNGQEDDCEVPRKNRDALDQILTSADLVKFAQYAPGADFNEKAYNDAYYFVEETKPEDLAGEIADIQEIELSGDEK